MAQGTIKKSAAKPPAASSRPASGKTKKGARVAKSKKTTTADKTQKKLNAGMTIKTEKLLGERAGHLEMIGKGRDKGGPKKEGEKGKATGGEKKVQTGGSRKFG
ncbi:uncharacterized protein BCR38DRAFT_138884 [Pseudomassariella vexata]|uniref:Uncharacterized protein n=1 Tax=Pseudomassariella vexata TaxID=1141098 RepID=A0A1Y2EDB0_9PEZI|nr:uncharacterized protein BCR38DRAFT_138884 [Pseudomassariella vexata]ORY68795.1 hypothetical protein BCR38DRAFT_138884 [Pseudomassariella vexata]